MPSIEQKHAVLLLGAPGVGKSTQTALLTKEIPNLLCVSTGELVRKLNKKVQNNLPLNPIEKNAAESLFLMRQGGLMDTRAVYALLFSYLSANGEGYAQYLNADTIIFDGVVKSFDDIAFFESALTEFNSKGNSLLLNSVINISAPEEVLIARQKNRVDEACRKGEEQRPDDNPKIYAKRLQEYLSKMEKVLDYYRAKPYFFNLDSTAGIHKITESLFSALRLTSFKAVAHDRENASPTLSAGMFKFPVGVAPVFPNVKNEMSERFSLA